MIRPFIELGLPTTVKLVCPSVLELQKEYEFVSFKTAQEFSDDMGRFLDKRDIPYEISNRVQFIFSVN